MPSELTKNRAYQHVAVISGFTVNRVLHVRVKVTSLLRRGWGGGGADHKVKKYHFHAKMLNTVCL